MRIFFVSCKGIVIALLLVIIAKALSFLSFWLSINALERLNYIPYNPDNYQIICPSMHTLRLIKYKYNYLFHILGKTIFYEAKVILGAVILIKKSRLGIYSYIRVEIIKVHIFISRLANLQADALPKHILYLHKAFYSISIQYHLDSIILFGQ